MRELVAQFLCCFAHQPECRFSPGIVRTGPPLWLQASLLIDGLAQPFVDFAHLVLLPPTVGSVIAPWAGLRPNLP
jgi:hypothetical protein